MTPTERETNCLEKNPCVEKYYSGLTKEQRLAEIERSIESLKKIFRNLSEERNKIIYQLLFEDER